MYYTPLPALSPLLLLSFSFSSPSPSPPLSLSFSSPFRRIVLHLLTAALPLRSLLSLRVLCAPRGARRQGLRETEDLLAVVRHLRASPAVTRIGLWGRRLPRPACPCPSCAE